MTRFLVPPLAYIAFVGLVTWAAGSLGDQVLDRVVIAGLANLTLVVSLFIFTGLSGVFSFAHAGFAAVGAYTTALFLIPPADKIIFYPELPASLERLHASPVVATLIGGTAAMLVAAVVAAVLMRLVGLAAALATFAVLVIIRVVAANWNALTAGTAGVTGIPISVGPWGAFAFAALAIAIAWLFQGTRFGLALRASREDEIAARSIGIGVVGERWLAFVVSGFLAGLAGGVYARFIGTLTPDVFYFSITFLTLAMLVVGGVGSLSGAVLGTVVITAVGELLRRAEGGFGVGQLSVPGRPGLREVGLALIMLVILLVRPAGLTGGRELNPSARLGLAWARRRVGDTTSPDPLNPPGGEMQ